MPLPDPANSVHIAGFGQPTGADAYLYRPGSTAEIFDVYQLARDSGRSVSFVGAGRSYGDPMMTHEGMAISLSPFSQISFENDQVTVGGGVTLDHLWRALLPQRKWPLVVSGTARTTVAGAIAMNIHGKNAFKVGTFEDSVVSINLVCPSGEELTITPSDERFHAVCGGAGLHGAIISATLRVSPIPSGGVLVSEATLANWDEQFEWFSGPDADYQVSWVDLTGGGRGVAHLANYAETPIGFDPSTQLPSSKLGSAAGKFLRPMLSQPGIRTVNALKFTSARIKKHATPYPQSLAAFNFLLDAMPNWERAYEPQGLLQFQVFAPRASALALFRELEKLQTKHRLFSTLGVMKAHRPTQMLLDYSVNGFSLALDFRREAGLPALVREMTDASLDAGGKFYLAKDSFLTQADFERMHSQDKIELFRHQKAQFDPEGLIESLQSRRLGLT